MITIGSLFSGACDGIALGLEWAGLGPVLWHAELDPWRRRVLARHWPDAILYEDVRQITDATPAVDLLCGGFPCTNVSIMGNKAGLDGDESGLWSEMLRVIQQVQPSIVFIENVSSLISASGGDLRCVCGWNRGRRGLRPHHEEIPVERKADLFDACRGRHERERPSDPSRVASGVRRHLVPRTSGDVDSQADPHVAYLLGRSRSLPPVCSSLPDHQGDAGRCTVGVPADASRIALLDDGDARISRAHEAGDPSSESSRSATKRATAEHPETGDCEVCGWPLGGAPRFAVSRTALGRVLGDLSAFGFDASWCCLRGTDVGYPVERERIFVMACAHEGGCEKLREAHDLDGRYAPWDIAHRRGACRPPPGPRDGAALRTWSADYRGHQSGVRRSSSWLSDRVERVGSLGDSAMPVLVLEAFRRLRDRMIAA